VNRVNIFKKCEVLVCKNGVVRYQQQIGVKDLTFWLF